METFINLQNILIDPKKSFTDFQTVLQNSDVSQFTYLCLLLNTAAIIKRQNFEFQLYLNLLVNHRKEEGYAKACINYTGYKGNYLLNLDNVSILMNACEKSSLATIQVLMKHPLIRPLQTDPNGMTALYYCIKNTDESQGFRMFQFIDETCPQILISNNITTLLFFAVEKFRLKITEYLLFKKGASANSIQEKTGNTPLHEIAKNSSRHCLEDTMNMIQLFLRSNCDLSIKNFRDLTAQQYAFTLRFNLSDILNDISQYILNKGKQDQFQGSESNETDLGSKKQRATTAFDSDGNYKWSGKFSEKFGSDNYDDDMSLSGKSLFSQIPYVRRQNQTFHKELSECLNLDKDIYVFDEDEISELQRDFQQKLECRSHLDSLSSSRSDELQNSVKSESEYIMSEYSEKEEESLDQISKQFCKIEEIDFMKIESEILQFDEISCKVHQSAWEEVEVFFNRLSQLVEPLMLKIQLIGSFATGLWTHISDIDIALVTVADGYVDFDRMLEKVYNKIRSKLSYLGIKQLCYNKASKLHSIKIDMDPILYGQRKIDLMIFHRNNTANMYVNFIRDAMFSYKQIRPLFFSLKRICQEYGLHDPFNGGLKSYSIFLMVYSIVNSIQYSNLGQFMLKLSLYYGFYHDYTYDFEASYSQQGVEQLTATVRLNITDPLNPKNNMGGKKTKTERVRDMFRSIYYGMHKKLRSDEGTTLQYLLELAHIV